VRDSLLLLLALAAACSGSGSADPCAALTKNFTLVGTRVNAGVNLEWGGSAASTYEIWAFGEGHTDVFKNPVTTVTDTSAGIGLTPELGTVVLEARPVAGTTACPTLSAALTVPQPPALTVTAQSTGVQLNWFADPLYGTSATISRGADADHLFTLSNASGGAYFDSAVDGGTPYTYVVTLHAPNLVAFSSTASVQTFPLSPAVTAQNHVAVVSLSWASPPGAFPDCFVSDDASSAPPQEVRGETSIDESCATASCSYSVSCVDSLGQRSPAGHASGHLVPFPPSSCSATSAVGGVRVAWGTTPGATGFRVERAAAGGPVVVTGNAGGSSVFDTSVSLFQPSTYVVRSVAADGTFDPVAGCPTAGAIAINAPAAMNVAASSGSLDAADGAGESFTVNTGGQLMAIELVLGGGGTSTCMRVATDDDPVAFYDDDPTASPFGIGCDELSAAFSGSQATFVPDGIGGSWFDLSSRKLQVSAGESIAFQIFGLSLAASEAAGDGGALVHGGAHDPGHDVLFKAYVLPSSAMTAPTLAVKAAAPDAYLTWTASPGGSGYDVLDAVSGAPILHTTDTHALVPTAAGGRFQVRATSADAQSTALSNAVDAPAAGAVVVASNLCATPAGSTVGQNLSGGPIEQTFTIQRSGILAGLDAALSNVFQLPVFAQILDADGNTLVQALFPAGNLRRPLSPNLAGAEAMILRQIGVHVSAGQVLRLSIPVVSQSAGAPIFDFSGDEYAGGAATIPGQSGAQDLCFKVYVDPH
jgi:hypothetical protein